MNTAIIISIIICATVVVLLIVACIHDTIKSTINARSMANFENAFKYVDLSEKPIKNPTAIVNDSAQDFKQIDFPNDHVETRPNKYR